MPGKKWFGASRTVIVMALAYSLLFLAFSIASAVTYSTVTIAGQSITYENPERIAQVLGNGTLFLGFNTSIVNPSPYSIHVTSINWYTELINATGSPTLIVLTSSYTAENVGVLVPAGADMNLSFKGYISGTLLARVNGFINYSNEHGASYTLTTAPYAHSFEFRGWLDDFKHDYLREAYLNGLVSIDLVYTYGMGE